MPYDVAAIRNKLKKQMSGKFVDPDEFRPPKAESTTDAIKYRFFILPPVMAGDKLKAGIVPEDQGMEHFFLSHANHWINDRPYPCPRVWAGSGECPICQNGFDLLKDEKDEDARKNIVRTWMPNTYYMVNIYFTNSNMNPEELRGKVKFYNAPKTLFDVWSATLMKDDAGDPEDPEAFGVFFDENAAFLFQLEVLKHGRNNSYKSSKFVPNEGKPQPMLKDPDKIPKLLAMRHNLFSKVEKPEIQKIEKLAKTLLDGDDFDDDDGFDEDEVKGKVESKKAESKKAESKKVESKKAESKKAESKKAESKKAESDDDLVSDDDDLVADDDDLVDESPMDDEPEEETPKTEPEESVDDDDDDDDDDDEINSLLDQLEDED